jgi:hypothetical protein
MFCPQCGNEIEQHARFCSKCGHEIAPASQPAHIQQSRPPHDMDMHINILGWLLIGTGVLTGVGGLFALFAGAMLRRLPYTVAPDMPVGIGHFAGGIATLLGLCALAAAAGVAAAGVGLIQYRSWARVFAIIMAVLLVFHFPIGTIVAVYAFWVLFSQEGQQYYKARSASTMTMSGT